MYLVQYVEKMRCDVKTILPQEFRHFVFAFFLAVLQDIGTCTSSVKARVTYGTEEHSSFITVIILVASIIIMGPLEDDDMGKGDEESPSISKVQFHSDLVTSTTSFGSNENSEDIDEPTERSPLRHSFHLGNSGITRENVRIALRRTPSFQKHGEDYELVPTKVVDNVKLVTDPTLLPNEKGTLYFAERSFYNNMEPPQYALTVNPDIYRKIFGEVNDAHSIPFGMYFCCHGGDGAHTGVSHDDYVDIELAWVLLGVVFLSMILLSLL